MCFFLLTFNFNSYQDEDGGGDVDDLIGSSTQLFDIVFDFDTNSEFR